jgi:hypothetical protein
MGRHACDVSAARLAVSTLMLCTSVVMTGLGPVIHAYPLSGKDVDGRDEHGHDGWGIAEPIVRIVTPISTCPIDSTIEIGGHLK